MVDVLPDKSPELFFVSRGARPQLFLNRPCSRDSIILKSLLPSGQCRSRIHDVGLAEISLILAMA